MTNIVSWLTVVNTVNEIMVNDSLRHTLKRRKKILRRTRALNVELKKFSSLKSYSEYVTIKTEILRNMSDNEDTDDEPLTRSAVVLDDSYIDNVTVRCNGQNGKNDLTECEYEEEAEEQQAKGHEQQQQKKSHPTITCTEIVKSKYTIIRETEDKSVDERCNLSTFSPDEHSLENNEAIQLDRLSPEARHGRLEHVKLSNDIYTSNSSEDTDDEMVGTRDNLQTGQKRLSKELSSPQTISEPSDCDKWYSSENESGKKSKMYRSQETNYSSYMSSSLQISDGNSLVDNTRKHGCDVPGQKSVKKSIKSQIAEQEFADSSNETMIRRDEAKSVANAVTNGVPSEADSLRYVLQNLRSSRSKNSPDHLSTDQIEYSTLRTSTPTIHCPTEVLPRPLELREFVHQQRLTATRELSTINIDDIDSASEQNGNAEIWLMEIPRSIATDRQLRGKKIVLKSKKMKIGDVSYKTIGRDIKSISCILSDGNETTHFKTVNLRPVGSIVVCQESCEMGDTLSSSLPCESSAVRRNATREGLVPFPNNLKTRNPLEA